MRTPRPLLAAVLAALALAPAVFAAAPAAERFTFAAIGCVPYARWSTDYVAMMGGR